jgi:hypothetical protein
MIYKIRILQYACFLCDVSINRKYFMMQNYNQLIEYFFPKIDYIIVEPHEKAHICITSNVMDDNSILRDDELNIFISIENITNPNFTWYNHYNKYGEYNNEKIKLYIYSHITNIIENNNFLSIPCIYTRINYFKNKNNYYFNHEKLNQTFDKKKFCLMINKSNLNPLINKVEKLLSTIGKIDSIFEYNNIDDKSCYNSIEFLEILNKYKFIICFENSSNDGYITEKIFNCFFAKTIPIYWGSSKISKYFNENSYIEYNEQNNDWFNKINKLNNNENNYNEYINSKKISDHYNDENYNDKFINYIQNKCKIDI